MYVLGIFRKEDGANIGKLELIKILRMDYQWAMMGYSIHNQYWKNGYGMESVKAAVSLFFNRLHFHRIELHIHVGNEPSVRLAERAGFSFECKREAFSLENGKWMDFLIYFKNKEMNI
ncbi:acetyltransferase, GNAT family [Bacillus sp. UMTAT18]|nr:acetyltransferase, GNAT family [Bacillus sp. UMTAT18]